jgi:hypothetical protein
LIVSATNRPVLNTGTITDTVGDDAEDITGSQLYEAAGTG